MLIAIGGIIPCIASLAAYYHVLLRSVPAAPTMTTTCL